MFIYSHQYIIIITLISNLIYVVVFMVFIQRDGFESRKLTHENDVCVACGICVDCCPTDSLSLNDPLGIKRGQSEGNYIRMDEDTCVLCGVCASACAFGALSFEIDGKDTRELANYPTWTHDSGINQEECKFCGRCYEACPQDTIFFKRVLPDRNTLLKGEIKFDEEKCIYCQICSEMCPAEAITLSSTDGKLLDKIEVDLDKCVYCLVCKRSCPQEAIYGVCSGCMYSDEFEKPEISGDIFIGSECINCGWCKDVCPVSAADVTKPFEGTLSFKEDVDCLACYSCVDLCACDALTMEDNASTVNPDHCVLCGACTKVCPVERIDVNRSSMKLENVASTAWKASLDKIIN